MVIIGDIIVTMSLYGGPVRASSPTHPSYSCHYMVAQYVHRRLRIQRIPISRKKVLVGNGELGTKTVNMFVVGAFCDYSALKAVANLRYEFPALSSRYTNDVQDSKFGAMFRPSR